MPTDTPSPAVALRSARRIAVVGCPGSGKTWLATRLAETTGLPYVGLDDHYFGSAWQPRGPAGQWARAHGELADGAGWIIDGLHMSTLDDRLRQADAVVWLDFPTRVCALGYLRRTARWRLTGRAPGYASSDRGAVRLPPDLLPFLWFILTFRRRERRRLAALLAARRPGCGLLRLRCRNDVRRLLGALPGGSLPDVGG